MGRGLDGGEQRLPRILAGHAQELAQGQGGLELAAALEGAEVGVDLGQQAAQVFLLGEGLAILPLPALAARGAMLGPEEIPAERFDFALMHGDLARPLVDDDAVVALAHLEVPADERGGHGVVIGVQRDIPLDVDEPLMKQVGLGDPAGQAAQGGVLGGKELARGGLEVSLGAGVDALTPGAGLAIGVGPVGEAPAGQKSRAR